MRPNHAYKPTVLTLPSLVLFTSLFLLSIALIERLIHNSSRPSRFLQSPTTTQLVKRYGYPTTVLCDPGSVYTSQLSTLEASYDALCSTFSTEFAPSATSLSPALQTAFSDWKQQLFSIFESQDDIRTTSNLCLPQPTSIVTGTFEITAGCTSSTTSRWNYNCPQSGGLDLVGSTLTVSFPTIAVPCGAAPNSQLVLATRTQSPSPAATIQSTTASTTAGSLSQGSDSTSSPVASTFGPAPTANIVITTTTSSNPAATTSPMVLANHEAIIDHPFTKVTYFVALFLGPLITVIIKAFYEVIIAALKLIEPFHRLKDRGGAVSSHSILAQYLSSSLSLDALRLGIAGHVLPLWSTAMFVLVGILPALIAASMSVKSTDQCLIDGVEYRCAPVWVINLIAVRSVEIILALCVCLAIGLIIWTWRYTVNIASNPSSIASVAMMLNHEGLLHDLQQINPDADEKEFNRCLETHRFWLDSHQDMAGYQRYGLIGQTDVHTRPPGAPGQVYAPINPSTKASRSNHHLKSMAMDLICLISLLALFGIVLGYYLDGSQSSFNTWFSSGKFLPKFVLVLVATLADVLFRNLERSVRITEPYRRLSQGNARPETTILLPLNGTSWSNLPRCVSSLFRYKDSRMLWQTTVTVVACLSDINIITVAGILFTEAQTHDSFVICSIITLVLSGLMLVVTMVTIFWWRRAPVIRSMPRRPETVGAVMSYLCSSSMVRMWMNEALVLMTEKQRDQTIAARGQRFKFAKMAMRWTVDFDDGGTYQDSSAPITSSTAAENLKGAYTAVQAM